MKIIVSNPDLDSITKHPEKQVFGYQEGALFHVNETVHSLLDLPLFGVCIYDIDLI